MLQKPVVLFGTGVFARSLAYYFHQYGRKTVAYTEDAPCDSKHQGLPLVPFNSITEIYPPDNFEIFIAVGNRNLNAIRDQKMIEVKEKGYVLASFIHPTAYVAEGSVIGENCIILEHSSIGPFSELKDGVLLFARTLVNHDCVIGRCCYLSACAMGGFVTIGERTFIGINATIRDNIRIGRECLLNAGALVLRDVPDRSYVKGNPSEIREIIMEKAFNFDKPGVVGKHDE